MGGKGKKRCGWKGCKRLVPDGKNSYCSEHREEYLQGFRDRARQGDYSRLYSTANWKRLRKVQLAMNPICWRCGKVGGVVDHRQPHRGDPNQFYDSNNLVTLCKPCHDQVTRLEIKWRKAGFTDRQIGEKKKVIGRVVPEKLTVNIPTQNDHLF